MHLPGNRPLVLSSLRFLRPPAAGVVLSPLAAVGPLCLGFWSSFVLLFPGRLGAILLHILDAPFQKIQVPEVADIGWYP